MSRFIHSHLVSANSASTSSPICEYSTTLPELGRLAVFGTVVANVANNGSAMIGVRVTHQPEGGTEVDASESVFTVPGGNNETRVTLVPRIDSRLAATPPGSCTIRIYLKPGTKVEAANDLFTITLLEMEPSGSER